jgi:integration host factor subunit alpha
MTENTTLTRAHLSNKIYHETGVSMQECNSLVDGVFEAICKNLCTGESVKLSSFGTFNLRHKKPRIGRNPKTGVEVEITARTVVSFNPSNLLKEKINKNLSSKK